MFRRRLSKKVVALFIGDLLVLYGALYSALLLRYGRDAEAADSIEHFTAFSVIFLLWTVFFGAFGFYELRFAKNERLFLYRLLQVMAANTVLAIVVFYFFPFFTIEPRRNLLLITLFAILFIFVWRSLFNLLIVRASAARVLFLGLNSETIELADYLLAHPQLGQRPVGFVSNGSPAAEVARARQHGTDGTSPAGSMHSTSGNFGSGILPHLLLDPVKFPHIVRDLKPEIIVVSPEMKGKKTVVKALFGIIPSGVSTIDFAPFHEMLTGKIPLSLIEEAWFLENLIGIKRRTYELAKRMIDIATALLMGIAALVTFPLIALAVKLDSEGSVFFRQKRIGRHGKEFTLIKYRSMVNNAHEFSGFKSMDRDPRQTRIGAILRRSYLDEIPQIINILKGEMSFVGPRPERPEYVRQLKEKVPFYEMRLLVPPGITGWAQINMEDDASVEDAPQKMQYDLYYVKNRSFILDFLIMLKTLFTLLRREGR